jgi:prepilin-type N-terminal cleavage/methylation domain-containing protein
MIHTLASRLPARRTQRGFSLIELVITIGVILIAMTFAMPSFLNYLRSARVRAGAQTVSAYLNNGRQLAIKRNAPVCVTNTTTTIQFRAATCGGTVLSAPGLTGSGNNIRLPDNVTITTTPNVIFGQLGNANTAGNYTVRDTTSGRTLTVSVAGSGRVTIAP